jgi:hypothetical protein
MEVEVDDSLSVLGHHIPVGLYILPYVSAGIRR